MLLLLLLRLLGRGGLWILRCHWLFWDPRDSNSGTWHYPRDPNGDVLNYPRDSLLVAWHLCLGPSRLIGGSFWDPRDSRTCL